MKTHKKEILILFAVSVVALVAVTTLLQLGANYSRDAFFLPDARSYREAAEQLYRHGFDPNAIRPFGYPLIIGLPYLAGLSADAAILNFAVVINIVCWLATVQVIYLLLAALANRRLALAGSVVFIFCISHIVSLYQSLSETMFLLLVMMSLYYFLRYISRQEGRHLLLSVGLLCFSVTVRPVSLYFAGLGTVAGLIIFSRRRQWKSVAAVALIFCGTIGLQLANMHRKFGSYTISYVQNYTLYMYLTSTAEHLQQGGDFIAIQVKKAAKADSVLSKYELGSVPYVVTADELYKQAVKKNMENNKGNMALALVKDINLNSTEGSIVIPFAKNYSGSGAFEWWKAVFIKLSRWQNKFFSLLNIACLAGLALVIVLRRLRADGALLFMIVMNAVSFYLLLTSGISFWQGDRFNMLLYPFTVITALYLLSTLQAYLRRRTA